MGGGIILRAPAQRVVSDDACTTITTTTYPKYISGPYADPDSQQHPTRYVPPLAYFCIRSLYKYVDQLHLVGRARLPYRKPNSTASFDILRALIPSYSPNPEEDCAEFSLKKVDPRLWGTIIQLYDGLPECFRAYKIPLADDHLLLLQSIPSSSQLSLITHLSLSGCRDLTDESIKMLKTLHTLCCLDVSDTRLTADGIKTLAETQLWRTDDSEAGMGISRRGVWGLRIISLRNCARISNQVFTHLRRFSLLSVVDVRGTACSPNASVMHPFRRCEQIHRHLFHPTTLQAAYAALTKASSDLLHSSVTRPFEICIDSTTHSDRKTLTPRLPKPLFHNSFTSIPLVRPSTLAAPSPRRAPVPTSLLPGTERNLQATTTVENDAAAAVISAQAAQNAVRRFYSKPTAAPRVDKRPSTPYSESEFVSPQDKKLMLFRDPPPWSILDSADNLASGSQSLFPTKPDPSARQLPTVKVNKRRFSAEVESLKRGELLSEFCKKRVVTPQRPAPSSSKPIAPISTKSKNPFAKPSDFERDTLYKLKAAVKLHNIPDFHDPATRVFKPITMLPIPPLPEHLLPKHRPIKKRRLTQTRLPGAACCDAEDSDPDLFEESGSPSVSSIPRKAASSVKRNPGPDAKMAKQVKAVSRKTSLTSSSRKPASMSGDASKGGYNWKRWSLG